ncbi:hypothetical protein N7449_000035 [Penicillium cf. viridicatum]|uniref:Uncharacterized protein n=1 Tax=Penicillium cf. viridicatum TaxID=2972119 RepID=A0A9W9N491_9EURO|nr:hypothetical protein N7449_000035 [Penicillium cf. viridicatum]
MFRCLTRFDIESSEPQLSTRSEDPTEQLEADIEEEEQLLDYDIAMISDDEEEGDNKEEDAMGTVCVVLSSCERRLPRDSRSSTRYRIIHHPNQATNPTNRRRDNHTYPHRPVIGVPTNHKRTKKTGAKEA